MAACPKCGGSGDIASNCKRCEGTGEVYSTTCMQTLSTLEEISTKMSQVTDRLGMGIDLRASKLHAYQEEMRAFTIFLKQRFLVHSA